MLFWRFLIYFSDCWICSVLFLLIWARWQYLINIELAIDSFSLHIIILSHLDFILYTHILRFLRNGFDTYGLAEVIEIQLLHYLAHFLGIVLQQHLSCHTLPTPVTIFLVISKSKHTNIIIGRKSRIVSQKIKSINFLGKEYMSVALENHELYCKSLAEASWGNFSWSSAGRESQMSCISWGFFPLLSWCYSLIFELAKTILASNWLTPTVNPVPVFIALVSSHHSHLTSI